MSMVLAARSSRSPEADQSAGDDGDFIVNGLTEYDDKGAERNKFLAWFIAAIQSSFLSRRRRLLLMAASATTPSAGKWRPSGSTVCHLAVNPPSTCHRPIRRGDIEPGPHQGTFATTRKDGHGRDAATVERVHAGTPNSKRAKMRTTVSAHGRAGDHHA